MTRLLKLLAGVLPLAIFFAAFAAVGDVLIATTLAVAGAIAQLVLTLSANKRTGVLVWISLALVLGLGSATLAGTDVRSLDLSPQPASCQGANCVCRMPVLPI
jgi:intracellular septation protein A